MKLNHLIAAWRKSARLTQAQFGELIPGRKRSQRSVAGWEAGDTKPPIDLICEALNITQKQFYDGPSGEIAMERSEPVENVAENNFDVSCLINPNALVPIYMLSEIRQSWESTPLEGFTDPGRLLQDRNSYCLVRVDIKTKNCEFGERLLINKYKPPEDGDMVLIWDKTSRKTSVEEFRHRLKSNCTLLGVVL